MTLQQRLPYILVAASSMERYLGSVSEPELKSWIESELGSLNILDDFVQYGSIRTKAIPTEPILAIISGNAAHSGLQTILRSLVLGAKTRLKLPGDGIPVVEKMLTLLPPELRDLFEIKFDIPAEWWDSRSVIAFGSENTMQEIHRKLDHTQNFLPHGHKLSIGITFENSAHAATLAAQDIARFNQQGCLSAINVYVAGETNYLSFASHLHESLTFYEKQDPRGEISLSESGAISNLREAVRYQAANDDRWSLYESPTSTVHTVIGSPETAIEHTPLNRTVIVKPLPDILEPNHFGTEHRYLSSVAVYPFTKRNISIVASLNAPRICELGKLQSPSLFWHHDGFPTLASLVTWQDLG